MGKDLKDGEKKTQIKCKKCVGSGFIKYEVKICEMCEGIKCMYCRQMGLEKMPWDLCDECYGDGYFMVKEEEKEEKEVKEEIE